MTLRLFITGTSTGVGKTYLSVELLNAFNRLGFSTLGIKPVASGCTPHNEYLYNDDALLLQQASSVKLPYDAINPFAFKPAIAPHIAANLNGIQLNLKQLNNKLHDTLANPVDIMLIEGAGGWHTPLNNIETMADFVTHHHFNTILVVGIQLGCINHAILTQRAIQLSGAPLIGWIANCMTPNIEYSEEQIKTLISFLPIPYLGIMKLNQSANTIDIKNILSGRALI